MFQDHESNSMDDFFSFGDNSSEYNPEEEGDELFRSMKIDDTSKTPYSDATQASSSFIIAFGTIK